MNDNLTEDYCRQCKNAVDKVYCRICKPSHYQTNAKQFGGLMEELINVSCPRCGAKNSKQNEYAKDPSARECLNCGLFFVIIALKQDQFGDT